MRGLACSQRGKFEQDPLPVARVAQARKRALELFSQRVHLRSNFTSWIRFRRVRPRDRERPDRPGTPGLAPAERPAAVVRVA